MRRDLKLTWGLRRAFLVGILEAGKLAGKGGEYSEVGGEHVALLTRMQGPVPTQK